jgi:hypothetical protein
MTGWEDRYRVAAERCAELANVEGNGLVREALIDAGHSFRKAQAQHREIKQKRDDTRFTIFQEGDLSSAERGIAFEEAERSIHYRDKGWRMLPDAEFDALVIYTMIERGE